MDTKSRKILETFLVSTALIIICCILFPSLAKIYNYSIKSTNETNTESAIKFTRDLYATLNLYEDVEAPFKVVFDKNSYTIYSKDILFTPTSNIAVDSKRELPSSGYIVINMDGTVIAQNLSYNIGGYICNATLENHPVCEKK